MLVTECLADYYRTRKLVVYEYACESRDPVEHYIRLFVVTKSDLKLLLDELQKDFEFYTASAEALVKISHTHMLLKRL